MAEAQTEFKYINMLFEAGTQSELDLSKVKAAMLDAKIMRLKYLYKAP